MKKLISTLILLSTLLFSQFALAECDDCNEKADAIQEKFDTLVSKEIERKRLMGAIDILDLVADLSDAAATAKAIAEAKVENIETDMKNLSDELYTFSDDGTPVGLLVDFKNCGLGQADLDRLNTFINKIKNGYDGIMTMSRHHLGVSVLLRNVCGDVDERSLAHYRRVFDSIR